MRIVYDPAKRDAALAARGLDMSRAGEVFDGPTLSVEDNRREYGETRFITIGLLDGRMVVMVCTERDGVRRVISLRKANDREQEAYGDRLGG